MSITVPAWTKQEQSCKMDIHHNTYWCCSVINHSGYSSSLYLYRNVLEMFVERQDCGFRALHSETSSSQLQGENSNEQKFSVDGVSKLRNGFQTEPRIGWIYIVQIINIMPCLIFHEYYEFHGRIVWSLGRKPGSRIENLATEKKYYGLTNRF